jgi:hypothetical protein
MSQAVKRSAFYRTTPSEWWADKPTECKVEVYGERDVARVAKVLRGMAA